MDLSSLLLPAGVFVVIIGAAALVYSLLQDRKQHSHLRNRLRVDFQGEEQKAEKPGEEDKRRRDAELADKAARRAAEFYASADPENVVRLRQTLMRAGYLAPDAVGKFFLIRFAAMGAGFVLAGLLILMMHVAPLSQRGIMILAGLSIGGYFAPAFMLKQKVSQRIIEYRNGFPDFMDLMIVCADAGMSLEASIERVSKEISVTYPQLAQNLVLVSLELRAGRSINEALKALADRLGVDEVRAFATLLQQSKELGTSLSGALKVFSDEMRHKRMSAAEEKAHALPAKMSIPVTVCILPVVVMIAIIPIIVRFNM